MPQILRSTTVGHGPVVIGLPSLGRPAGDLVDLGRRLAATGHQFVGIDLHGIGGSPPLEQGASLHVLVADVAETIVASLGDRTPVHVVGHALGNRVARCLCADRPDLIASVTVLGCGGRVPGDPEAMTALLACFDSDLDRRAHRDAVVTAFFAPGNRVPAAWLRGWHREAATAQVAALERTEVSDWWIPPPPIEVLAIVGTEDRVAPVANMRRLVDELGPRGHGVEVPRAGHALLPEQPERVASEIARFVRRSNEHRPA